MKALILCAGLGTRLLPHTRHIPKPLFPIDGRPLLDRIIHSLIQAGCRAIMINTHHLHRSIETFLEIQHYAIPVHTRHEPRILGTGGALHNLRDFWDHDPFMVINGDIVTDIDLKAVYDFHRRHPHPVSLVLHDFPAINTVSVDNDLSVIGFDPPDSGASESVSVRKGAICKLTFTGIQVIDPDILEWIADAPFSTSIDLYRTLLSKGMTIRAYIPENTYWKDIGTPRQFRSAVLDRLLPRAFPDTSAHAPMLRPLAGDGSDRQWFRASTAHSSVIVADHGIHCPPDTPSECRAFTTIGRHLFDRGVSVPQIVASDDFSGLVLLEDLGDVHLQTVVQECRRPSDILRWYDKAIQLLVTLSVDGADGFDPSWTWQTPCYDKALILEKECRYFVDAFLQGYLGMDVPFTDVADECDALADGALTGAVTGFMHRDFQSRNILVKAGRLFAIDFQGGRIGPVQYDLASLLIDPYVDIDPDIQNQLLERCIQAISERISIDPASFTASYRHCRITRNLQALGAYGYLTRVKGKPGFEKYIPPALETLNRSLSVLDPAAYPKLVRLTAEAREKLERGIS